MANEPLLLEDKTRRKFDQLMLLGSKVRAGAIKGDRRSVKRGTSIEFADYRNYSPGDDLRRMDWNVYARTDRPYIKLMEDEEDLAVHILLDTSGSMDWPKDGDAPEDMNKLLYGRRLAAGLAYISLGSNDRLSITAMNRASENYGPVRGRGHTVSMLRYAHSLKADGITNLNTAMKDYTARSRRPGLCFVISDMFSPDGYIDGLNTLVGRGYEVVILHLLSPDEVTPPLTGDLRLIDAESGAVQEVSLDATMREMYVNRVEAWRNDIRAECSRRGVHYLFIQTDTPWEKVILYELRKFGLVK